MAERKTIGLTYHYDENWIGGTYYIENIIKSFLSLSPEQLPHVIIFTDSINTFNKLKDKVRYPYLEFYSIHGQYNFIEKVINGICVRLFKKKIIHKKVSNNKVDLIFPHPGGQLFSQVENLKKTHWIPDLQELHLPQFFSAEELESRKQKNDKLAKNANNIVFSSKSALQDFEMVYPNSTVNKILLPFAVTAEEKVINSSVSERILNKYNISENEYFIVPNQLWIHKNHTIIIEAIQLLKQQGSSIKILCTGKEFDFRYPNYPQELKQKTEVLGLNEQLQFLGFIPKIDLEVLIQNASAVIQPSLFEGWNTGIEESKSALKFILASDIPVHREQLDNYPNKKYFSNTNATVLAEELKIILEKHPEIIEYDYSQDVKKFAGRFLQLADI